MHDILIYIRTLAFFVIYGILTVISAIVKNDDILIYIRMTGI
jgi:hypothetical protein